MKHVVALAASLSFANLGVISSFGPFFAQAAPITSSYPDRIQTHATSILDEFDTVSLLQPAPVGQLSAHANEPDSDGAVTSSPAALGILDPILHSSPLGWLDDKPRPDLDTSTPSPCTTEVPSATPTRNSMYITPFHNSTFTLSPILDPNPTVKWLDDLCICNDSCDNSDECECDEEDYVTWVCEYSVWDSSPCVWRPEVDG